ncbi:hypothetical protein TSAR_002767 [Trichomalopsis sarcophagae]|uniref:Uncharacterized protein n=1 Tax=Trichomalopsis sarcophagae TaxID=543379 RepID=A0A232EZA5_9HYME|nr:hypothetical protein TSAR_002767 [Trichomalopsis sarcophagae]
MKNKHDISYQQQALMSFITHDPVRYSTHSLKLAELNSSHGKGIAESSASRYLAPWVEAARCRLLQNLITVN